MKDRLDSAIDSVAGRLTNVREDPGLALRIFEALPARSAWSLHWLMPRLAITAVLAIATAYVVLRTFDGRSTNVLRTEGAIASRPVVEPSSNGRRTPVEPPLIIRRTTVEPSSYHRRTISDHEFSLPSIQAPEALVIESMAPEALAAVDALELASLVLADLPLSSDFSPR